MKLYEDIFLPELLSFIFWDKSSQDINFKSNLNSVLIFTLSKIHVPFGFVSLYLFTLTFAPKLKDTSYKSHWNILLFSNQWKIMSNLNMLHGEMSDFVSFPLFGFTLVINLRNLILKVIKILQYFLIKEMVRDLNMSCQTVSDLV